MSAGKETPAYSSHYCTDVEGLVDEGMGALRDACVRVSDLAYVRDIDGSPALVALIQDGMAQARASLDAIRDYLPKVDNESREHDAALAKIAALEARVAELENTPAALESSTRIKAAIAPGKRAKGGGR